MEGLIRELKERLLSRRRERARAALGELGRVRGVPARPATLTTLIYLNALYGSVAEAFGPLLEGEPDPVRLARLYALLEITTRERPPNIEHIEGEIQRVERRLRGATPRDMLKMAQLLVKAFSAKP